jgi:hypothetical protein
MTSLYTFHNRICKESLYQHQIRKHFFDGTSGATGVCCGGTVGAGGNRFVVGLGTIVSVAGTDAFFVVLLTGLEILLICEDLK